MKDRYESSFELLKEAAKNKPVVNLSDVLPIDGKTPLSSLQLKRQPSQLGKKFGRLTVLHEFNKPRGGKYKYSTRSATCQCDCGSIKDYTLSNLKNGHTSSCGCFQRERTSRKNVSHGHCSSNHRSKEYQAWTHLKDRCNNPKNKNYRRYGGRGISVYEGWVDDFPAFLEYMGKAPSKESQIDRINNEKGYEMGNLRWVRPAANCRNRRSTKLNPELVSALKGYRLLGLNNSIASFTVLSKLIGCNKSTSSYASLGDTWKEIEPMTNKSQILKTITKNFKQENLAPLPDFSRARAILRKHSLEPAKQT